MCSSASSSGCHCARFSLVMRMKRISTQPSSRAAAIQARIQLIERERAHAQPLLDQLAFAWARIPRRREHVEEVGGVSDIERLVHVVVHELARIDEAALNDALADRARDLGEHALDDA